MKSRNQVQTRSKPGLGVRSGSSAGGFCHPARTASGLEAARAWIRPVPGTFEPVVPMLRERPKRGDRELYIERWLKAPAEEADGTRVARDRGTPQGGVISPLLANIFLHHVFDLWMSGEFPGCPFERYADDIVIHCATREEALAVKAQVEERLRRCKLEAHPDKTRIVYCRDSKRRQDHEQIQFDFLGYTFRPRQAKNRR